MKLEKIANALWGERAKLSWLILASVIMLFSFLGAREIWTQEHRWADIVSGMFYRHDFLHPYLGTNDYYDKPLLSYWLIAALTKLTGALTNWQLRIPSALSGVLAVYAIYQLGCNLRSRQLGLLAGWLLVTTFYFIFWARVSSADMLNLAGSVLAVSWYFKKRLQPSFLDLTLFFIIIALTSLCKGLIGAIVPFLVILPDLILRRAYFTYLRPSTFIAMIPGVVIYILPFWLSTHFGGDNYGENGLYLVYKENILRYFQPFDHKGPLYTYFLYLPIYTLPWAFLLFPALLSLPWRYRNMNLNSRWICWALCILFLFFTLSGSRRSYYVLPMVPFAILFIADWISTLPQGKIRLAGWLIGFYLTLFMLVDLVPTWFYSHYGVNRFAVVLKKEAGAVMPWREWQVVMLDAESKLDFYLQLPPTTLHLDVPGDLRDKITIDSLAAWWPILNKKPENTIFITRKQYVPYIESYLTGYSRVELATPHFLNRIDKQHAAYAPVAFIPPKA